MGHFKERTKAFFSPTAMTFGLTTGLGKRASDDSQVKTPRNSGSSVTPILNPSRSWTSNKSTTNLNSRTARPETAQGWLLSPSRKTKENRALFNYGDFVHHMPETLQLGIKQEYWIAERLYDPDNGYHRYLLKYGPRLDGAVWGWAAEPALRMVGQMGITIGAVTDQPFEVMGHGTGGLGLL